MARGPLNKSNSNSLASAGKGDNSGLLRAAIITVNTDGTLNTGSSGQFLLNPSTWDDGKSTGWVAQKIPGQSNPIHQWVAGDERIVSFQALVTKDTSDFLKVKNSNPIDALKDKALTVVGNLASKFFNVAIPPLGDLFGGSAGGEGNDLSIDDCLNYYRSLQYPTYVDGKLTASPPLVVLYVGNSLSKVSPTLKISRNDDVWIVLDAKITITKQLPNLNPMEALVDFKLAQYAVSPIGADHFTGEVASKPSSGLPSVSDVLKGF